MKTFNRRLLFVVFFLVISLFFLQKDVLAGEPAAGDPYTVVATIDGSMITNGNLYLSGSIKSLGSDFALKAEGISGLLGTALGDGGAGVTGISITSAGSSGWGGHFKGKQGLLVEGASGDLSAGLMVKKVSDNNLNAFYPLSLYSENMTAKLVMNDDPADKRISFGSFTGDRFDLVTNNQPRVTITKDGNVGINGNVGIGTTDLGTARLAVMGGNMGIGVTNPTANLELKSMASQKVINVTDVYGAGSKFSVGFNGEVNINGVGSYLKVNGSSAVNHITATFNNSQQGGTGVEINVPYSDGPPSKFIVFKNGDSIVGSVNGVGPSMSVGTPVPTVVYATAGSDYAEYFEAGEDIAGGKLVGLELSSGKIRKWQAGDPFIGITSIAPGFIGNQDYSNKKDKKMVLVGLVGQLDLLDKESVAIESNIVKTTDGQKIGYLLSNGKVFISK